MTQTPQIPISADEKLKLAIEFIEDIVDFGTRHDLNPTRMMYEDPQQVAVFFLKYMESMDKSVRLRAEEALAKLRPKFYPGLFVLLDHIPGVIVENPKNDGSIYINWDSGDKCSYTEEWVATKCNTFKKRSHLEQARWINRRR